MRMHDNDPVQNEPDVAASVWRTLVQNRTSTRRFTDRPVPDAWIAQRLQEARQAPSGANLQPGEFLEVAGAARQRLSDGLIERSRSGITQTEDYSYFPVPMPMTLRRRQVAAAKAIYEALGLARAALPRVLPDGLGKCRAALVGRRRKAASRQLAGERDEFCSFR